MAIATVGRPDILKQSLARLARQSRMPDAVLVSTVSPADVSDLSDLPLQPEIIFGEKGLCRQRNHALRAIDGRADVVIFFDDDFVAADRYLEEAEALLTRCPDLVGATGRIIADGINGPGYSFADALALLDADSGVPPAYQPMGALYGCNMIIRLAAANGLLFDEDLPFYGWLEDIDFTYRLGQRGRMCKSSRLAGVHMGAKGGRNSGLCLGYSQIANPVHLLRKHSGPPLLIYHLMSRNIASNLLRSLKPEPWIDRSGRLRGNVRAILDLARGSLDPRRVMTLE